MNSSFSKSLKILLLLFGLIFCIEDVIAQVGGRATHGNRMNRSSVSSPSMGRFKALTMRVIRSANVAAVKGVMRPANSVKSKKGVGIQVQSSNFKSSAQKLEIEGFKRRLAMRIPYRLGASGRSSLSLLNSQLAQLGSALRPNNPVNHRIIVSPPKPPPNPQQQGAQQQGAQQQGAQQQGAQQQGAQQQGAQQQGAQQQGAQQQGAQQQGAQQQGAQQQGAQQQGAQQQGAQQQNQQGPVVVF